MKLFRWVDYLSQLQVTHNQARGGENLGYAKLVDFFSNMR